ncbi:hypothetical protein S820908_171 [Synechococcus phage S-CAM9]|uniref:Uncharacterized protein n=1 Tax=Synechococcus phage S-CAM9 TaxID=1883369 RepID=A0A1D8KQ19_9CAUD|nr:hypothetical protein BOW85_gp077 [Synechococcus phage S-CAM9]AOV60318.1 hypothetical protein S050808_171 [Synechococcus phage S-CAM9]AOV60546.1 hypothetical protein S820908_171 [Synechococcus phage S-CAM9]AOV60775.1 hypothetical protein N161109_172 [Synechococcus phage S-CAM9]
MDQHQEIKSELLEIKGMLKDVISQMQSMRERIEIVRQQNSRLWVSEYDDDYLR